LGEICLGGNDVIQGAPLDGEEHEFPKHTLAIVGSPWRDRWAVVGADSVLTGALANGGGSTKYLQQL